MKNILRKTHIDANTDVSVPNTCSRSITSCSFSMCLVCTGKESIFVVKSSTGCTSKKRMQVPRISRYVYIYRYWIPVVCGNRNMHGWEPCIGILYPCLMTFAALLQTATSHRTNVSNQHRNSAIATRVVGPRSSPTTCSQVRQSQLALWARAPLQLHVLRCVSRNSRFGPALLSNYMFSHTLIADSNIHQILFCKTNRFPMWAIFSPKLGLQQHIMEICMIWSRIL